MARSKSKALTNVQAEMQKEIANIQDTIGAPAANVITVKGKKFKFPTGEIAEPPMDVVIIDYVSSNLFYKGKYDAKNPTPPVCWAIGKEPLKLVPSGKATDQQSATCGKCPMNEFGSGVGDAKACKNTRVLAVMAPDASKEDDPIYTISVSPTALKNFDTYVRLLADSQNTLPVGVITTIAFDPQRDHECLIFGKPRPNPNLEYHWSRREEAKTMLTAEPQPREDTGGGGNGRKTGGRSKKKSSSRRAA